MYLNAGGYQIENTILTILQFETTN